VLINKRIHTVKKLNSNGFGVVGLVLVVVVIAGVSGAGWYVWKSKQDKPAPKAAVVVRCEKPSDVKGWLQYEPEGKSYKVCLPDGWQLNELSGVDSLEAYKSSSLTYREGTLAMVSKGSPVGSDFIFSMSLVGDVQMYAPGEKQQLVDAAGTVIDKYTFTQTGEPDILKATPKGATDYAYFVKQNGKTARVNYRALPGEPNNFEIVEKMVKSLQIN
jgi:hypothetical protein